MTFPPFWLKMADINAQRGYVISKIISTTNFIYLFFMENIVMDKVFNFWLPDKFYIDGIPWHKNLELKKCYNVINIHWAALFK